MSRTTNNIPLAFTLLAALSCSTAYAEIDAAFLKRCKTISTRHPDAAARARGRYVLVALDMRTWTWNDNGRRGSVVGAFLEEASQGNGKTMIRVLDKNGRKNLIGTHVLSSADLDIVKTLRDPNKIERMINADYQSLRDYVAVETQKAQLAQERRDILTMQQELATQQAEQIRLAALLRQQPTIDSPWNTTTTTTPIVYVEQPIRRGTFASNQTAQLRLAIEKYIEAPSSTTWSEVRRQIYANAANAKSLVKSDLVPELAKRRQHPFSSVSDEANDRLHEVEVFLSNN